MKKLFKLLLIVVGFSLAALAQTNAVSAKTNGSESSPVYSNSGWCGIGLTVDCPMLAKDYRYYGEWHE